ncbi:hypothetical protein D1610_13800 [Sphingomonas gilva]|uniref:DUF2946 domain-containing protein n=1 Tax=Sphingomonas gilva TaxID=2305907 RepID=A0A396S0D2_9SPHN|nr:hypothetical protein [Sphingomonas gilva]RHW16795.1 hypothetical protein D1610_13800 [Sphingomonas gilva]
MFAGIRDGSLMPRPIALAILGAALLLRVLIPTGWMPAHGADGATRITLCTGMGLVQAWVDADGTIHDKQPREKSAADQPCAFAGLAMAGDLPDVAALLEAAALPIATPLATRSSTAIGQGLAAPPPPATGPPAFA